jgi:uncharacterized surface anchored protein
MVVFWFGGLYEIMWEYAGMRDLARLTCLSGLATGFILLFDLIFRTRPISGTVLILGAVFNTAAIAGVRFEIYALNEDGSTGDLVSTMLTNDDGVAMSESLLVGDYMVKEHEAPVGYRNSLWSEKVTVVMDETIERSVTNMPMQGQVRIVKTDAETGGSLAGAVFTVIRVSGLPSHGKEGCGEVVAVITTDAEGVAVTPVLTWGIYEIRETAVPEGYLDSGCVVTVSIPGNAD